MGYRSDRNIARYGATIIWGKWWRAWARRLQSFAYGEVLLMLQVGNVTLGFCFGCPNPSEPMQYNVGLRTLLWKRMGLCSLPWPRCCVWGLKTHLSQREYRILRKFQPILFFGIALHIVGLFPYKVTQRTWGKCKDMHWRKVKKSNGEGGAKLQISVGCRDQTSPGL